jgi:hypothetical protein
MGGFLTGSQFGWRVAWRIAIFLVFTLGFPFIVYGIVLATGARAGGSSGAVAIVAGVFLKPVIIIAFLIAMISPCWRRMRSLGLPSYWGLLVPLLLASDYTYLFVVGNFWGASFSMGFLSVQAPLFAMTALVLMVSMSLAMPPSGDEPQGLSRFGIAGRIAAVLAIAMAVIGLVSLTYNGWWYWMIMSNRADQIFSTYGWVSKFFAVFWKAKPFVCVSLSALSLWLAVVSRRNGGGEASTPSRSRQLPPTALAAAGSSHAMFGKR